MQDPSQSQAEQDADELAERFFSQPPEAWEVGDEPEPWRPAPLTRGERLAMLATVVPVLLGVSVAIGLFVFSDPLFASAEPKATQAAAVAEPTPAIETPAHDPTQHGLTALAKASPIAAPAIDAPPPPIVPAPAAPSALATKAPGTAPRPAAPNARSATAGSPLARARKALDAGKPLEARTLATEAISRNPSAAAAYIVLAGALDALGDRAGMQATFRSCAERATDSLASACRSLVR